MPCLSTGNAVARPPPKPVKDSGLAESPGTMRKKRQTKPYLLKPVLMFVLVEASVPEVELVPEEALVLQVTLALNQAVLMAHAAHATVEHLEQLVILVSMVATVMMVTLASQESEAEQLHLEPSTLEEDKSNARAQLRLEMLDPKDQTDKLDQLAITVLQVLMLTQAPQDQLAHQAQLDPLDNQAVQDNQDQLANSREAERAMLALQEQMANQAQLDPLDNQAVLVMMAVPDLPVHQEMLVQQAVRVMPAIQVPLAIMAETVLLAVAHNAHHLVCLQVSKYRQAEEREKPLSSAKFDRSITCDINHCFFYTSHISIMPLIYL